MWLKKYNVNKKRFKTRNKKIKNTIQDIFYNKEFYMTMTSNKEYC